MMPGILKMLEGVAGKKKLKWDEFLKDLKEKGEWIIFSFCARYPPSSPSCSYREASVIAGLRLPGVPSVMALEITSGHGTS